MPIMRRGGRPGLVGLAARTAVVTGTAAAVQNAAATRSAAAEQPRIAPETVEVEGLRVAHVDQVGLVEDLTALAALRQAGALTEAEFVAAKARLID